MVLLYLWTNLLGREHWWVREGIKLCGFLELFNSSKKMTSQGRDVQQGLVSSSIANSHSPPMSQLHTHSLTINERENITGHSTVCVHLSHPQCTGVIFSGSWEVQPNALPLERV
jgi:hypothetical protein